MSTDRNEALRLAEIVWECIYDHGNGKYKGPASMGQRLRAFDALASLRQQAEQIAELEGERDKLIQGIAQGLDGQTLLTDLALREGGLYAGIEGGAAGLLAAGFAEQFVEAGGINYVEVSFTHPKTGPLVVTLQRTQGKTPHKLRAEAEAERDQLRAELALRPWRPISPARIAALWAEACKPERPTPVMVEAFVRLVEADHGIDHARTTHKDPA